MIQHRPDRAKPWRARIHLPGGREMTRSFERRADAEKWERDQRAKLDRNEWIDPRAGRATFAAAVADYIAGKADKRTRTIESYREYARRLDAHLGHRPVGTLGPADIRKVQSALLAKYSATTARNTMVFAHSVLNQLAADRIIPISPALNVELPDPSPTSQRFLTMDEVQALVEAMHPRFQSLVMMAAATGLRWGELAGLRVQRLDLLRRRLTVAETLEKVGYGYQWGPPKSKASARTVTFPRSVAASMNDYLTTYGPGTEGTVWSMPRGGPLHDRNFRTKYWWPAVDKTVGRPMRFHDLRHTHVAQLITQGEHVKAIQQRLGHGSIKVTMDVYGHLLPDYDADLADRLDEAWVAAETAQRRPKTPDDPSKSAEN